MPNTIKNLEKSAVECAAGAFDAFCDDISGMFGITVAGNSSEQKKVTLKELKSEFKKCTAVFIVESKGSLNGNFYVILDQDALFTLAGTFVMLPEKVIVQNRKTGKEKEANEIADAVGEVGNLLVGAWDRFFREEMEGHEHLLQTGTFIGKPWLKPEEYIGMDKEGEFVAVNYEMTVDPFDSCVCMAAFPKPIFESEPQQTKDQATEESEEQVQQESPEQPEAQTAQEPADQKPEEPKELEDTKSAAEETAEKPTEEPAEEPAAAEKETPQAEEQSAEQAEVPENDQQQQPDDQQADQQADQPENNADVPAETDDRPVSKVIEQMTHSPATLPGEITSDFLTDIHAKNVMRTDLAWAGQDDTVETVLNKMQQANTGYALIGSPNDLHGIVSKSDIQGALSPYLQSIFSKWKRELDTATLQIKVRWIMSRPVHTLRPDATLATVMETMCKHSVRALPIADENGICGLVTVYTIFTAITSAADNQADHQGQNTDVPALS